MGVVKKDGYINQTGTFGAHSDMISPDDVNLLEYIEDGIKDFAKFFIRNGYKTKNSCQGHFDKEYGSASANLIIILREKNDYNKFLEYVFQYNLLNQKELIQLQLFSSGFINPSKFGDLRIIFTTQVNEKGRYELDKSIRNFQKFIEPFLE